MKGNGTQKEEKLRNNAKHNFMQEPEAVNY